MPSRSKPRSAPINCACHQRCGSTSKPPRTACIARRRLSPGEWWDLRLDNKAIVCFPGELSDKSWRGSNAMAEEKMALLDVLRKGEEPDGDVLVEGLRWLLQELMDAEVSAQIGIHQL